LYSECQIFTSPFVATPPKAFCFSTITTDAPNRAALTAAKTPVQLPPSTQMSNSPITGMFFFLRTYCLLMKKITMEKFRHQ
jgi:hypothetical protein